MPTVRLLAVDEKAELPPRIPVVSVAEQARRLEAAIVVTDDDIRPFAGGIWLAEGGGQSPQEKEKEHWYEGRVLAVLAKANEEKR